MPFNEDREGRFGGGDRDRDRDRDERGGKGGAGGEGGMGFRRGRRRVCRFCANAELKIDYKNTLELRHFVTDRGKITPRRISGNCALHQREVTRAIKRS